MRTHGLTTAPNQPPPCRSTPRPNPTEPASVLSFERLVKCKHGPLFKKQKPKHEYSHMRAETTQATSGSGKSWTRETRQEGRQAHCRQPPAPHNEAWDPPGSQLPSPFTRLPDGSWDGWVWHPHSTARIIL